jgi:hypothetical protein
MAIDREDVLRKANEVISLAKSEGKASTVLFTPPAQSEADDFALFTPPDERVLSVCGVIKSVAEVVTSIPDPCRSAMDKVTRDSQVAGVFRQEDVWICVAVGSADQLEIYAVLVAES